MKVPAKTKLTASEREIKRAFDNFFANFDKQVDAYNACEEAARIANAEARTRRAIERQCRKKYYREKYTAMGLWPLPPEGTPVYV
ncbi:hypothetical protein RlegWSM1455_07145 [Rhizobium laguerreae]|uniref:hypothetical protein n=1 Tax=Rhizobium laguerreae TaxID=1076926 RepID=UPI001E399D90|nr:hypothetical protein [Rhizobium laguerreae]UFW65790.1 hypothetical protein RlegWSM1455_07145 [Rhizobium laguerreae]